MWGSSGSRLDGHCGPFDLRPDLLVRQRGEVGVRLGVLAHGVALGLSREALGEVAGQEDGRWRVGALQGHRQVVAPHGIWFRLG